MISFSHVLAFLVEVGALVAFAKWGWVRFDTTFASLVAALVCAGLLAMLWGALAAPKSKQRLDGPWLLAFKLAVFAAATTAFADMGRLDIAGFFALAAAVHLILALSVGDL
jgi:hypothetical protein